MLGRKRKFCSSVNSCTTTSSAESSTIVISEESLSSSHPSPTKKKTGKPPTSHRNHRPETKAKIDLFNKIKSAEKCGTDIIRRSLEESRLWEMFKTGKSLLF